MPCHSAEPRPCAPGGCLNPDSVPQEGTLRASLRIPELDLRATAHRLCPDGPPDQPQEGAEAHAAAARRRCPAGVSGTGRPAPRTAVNALLSPPRVRLGLRRVGVRWRGRPSSGPRAEEFGDFEGAVLATVCRERRDSTLAKKAAFGSRRNGARVFTERRQTCAGTSAAWTPVSSGRPNRRETQHPRRFTGHGYVRDRRDSFAYLHGASTAPGLRCLGDTSSATPSCYILSAGEVGEGDGVAEVAELVVVLAAAGDQAQFCSVGGVAVDRPGGEFVFLVALYAVGDEHGG
jgi:hypothetical protein